MMKKIQFKQYHIFFILLYSFVTINWIILSRSSVLAPPDYYKYFTFSEKLFSADFSNFTVPPLFPFLLGAVGNFLSIFPANINPFILGGQLISLLSVLGIIYFSNKLIKNLTGSHSLLAVSSIIIFPFFLKFFSLPITDILFVFFVISSFYYFLEPKTGKAFIMVSLGVFTRFEGMLLVFSMILNSLKSSTKKIKILIFIIITFFLGLLTYFISSQRLLNKISFIISNKSYLFFLLNPDKLVSLFYVNFFFFLPDNIHFVFRSILIILFFGVVLYGYIFIYGINKKFALSLILYKVLFFIGKGYIAGASNVFDPLGQSRRMLSVIFLFWLIFMVGLIILTGKLKKIFQGKVFVSFQVLLLSAVIVMVVGNISVIKKSPSILLILFFCIAIFFLFKYKVKKNVMNFLTILLLFLSMYSIAFNNSKNYISSLPNRGAYMIAMWANSNLNENETLICYSINNMVEYYTNSKFKLIKPYVYHENIYRDSTILRGRLRKLMKKNNIRFIAFEFYMNHIDLPGEVKIKKRLYRNRKKKGFFKLKKYLFYKGKIVAMVMKAVN